MKLGIGPKLRREIESAITEFSGSQLEALVLSTGENPMAVKFVDSQWAVNYATSSPLKISERPALTWGTGTYVSPLACPLSSVLYGRLGIVAEFDPTHWRIFDATRRASRVAYTKWVRQQPAFRDLLMTAHSTAANHDLRNTFRTDFRIDCVLFRPDQEADLYADLASDVWMLVTDWTPSARIDTTFSTRLVRPRFTILIDEEFDLVTNGGLPIARAPRKIEATTANFRNPQGMPIGRARLTPELPHEIARSYRAGSYLHLYIEP